MKKKLWLLLPAALVVFIVVMTVKDAKSMAALKSNSMDYISHDVMLTLRETDLRIYGYTEANTDRDIRTYLAGPDKEAAEAMLKETYGDIFVFRSIEDKRVAGIYIVRSPGYVAWQKEELQKIADSLGESPLNFRFNATVQAGKNTGPVAHMLFVRLFAVDPDAEQIAALLAEHENVTVYISERIPNEYTAVQYSAGYSGEKIDS